MKRPYDRVQSLSHKFVTFVCKKYCGYLNLVMSNIFTFSYGKMSVLSDGNNEKGLSFDLMLNFWCFLPENRQKCLIFALKKLQVGCLYSCVLNMFTVSD